jgi:MarR family transcriptional regulator, transcriptional regulator for hemolysin
MAMKSLASLSYRVSLIARTQRTRFDQRARSIGITLSQWRAIFAISIDEGTSQRRIAETIDVGDVAAGRLVDRLVDNGWVERRADPADRRTHRLYLTPAARPLLDRLAALGQSEEAMALEGLDARDIDVALAVLDRVIANLERAGEAGETCRDPGDLN